MKRALIFVLLAVAACGQNERDSQPRDFRVVEVARGLEVPWSIAFAPNDQILVTERPGRLRVIDHGVLRPEPLHVFPQVASRSEDGLMGLALHPDYAQNYLLYVSYTYRTGSGSRVRVERFRNTGSALVDAATILDHIPAARYHSGCRLAFGPDRKLYITTGDATDRSLAQRVDSLAGKILRVNDDGSIPSNNPIAGSPIFSLGHRNAQGLAWQPGTNALWSTEHGPTIFDGPGGGDEVNLIRAGRNYGWPLTHHTQTQKGLIDPVLEYTPAIAPASAAFYNGPIASLRGNFLFGCLRGKRLQRVVIDAGDSRRVISQGSLVSGFGRIREVAMGPDGALYFSTSNRDGRGDPAAVDDRIMKIVPK